MNSFPKSSCCNSRRAKIYRRLGPPRGSILEPDPIAPLAVEMETLSGAIDIDEKVILTGSRWTDRSWVPTDPVVSSTLGWRQRTMKQRPATKVNPVRADGTRQPSEFWTFWFNGLADLGYTSSVRRQGVNTTRSWVLGGNGLNGAPDLCYPPVAAWSKKGASPLLFPQSVVNSARTRVRKELSETDWDLGVFAGEIRETASMFTDAATRIVKGINNIAKSVSKSPKAVTRFLRDMERRSVVTVPRHGPSGPSRVSPKWARSQHLSRWKEAVINDWLLLQFGIKPLLHDIEDSVEFLAELGVDYGLRPKITVRKGAQELVNSTLVLPTVENTSEILVPVQTITACHIAATYEIGIRPGFATRAGLTNFASVGWNLLRFTWVVDYAIGVGQWLDSLVLPDNVSFLEGTESRIQRTVNDGGERFVTRITPSFTTAGWVSESAGVASIRIDIGRFERKLLPAVGVLPPTWPQVKLNLDLTRVANLLAVLTKVLR